jgi:hypothetical protein
MRKQFKRSTERRVTRAQNSAWEVCGDKVGSGGEGTGIGSAVLTVHLVVTDVVRESAHGFE